MSRPSSFHYRTSSVGPGFNLLGNQQPSPLVSRINEKKIELENLKQLRDLSANLAKQLRDLQAQIETLTDGTEVVASVLSNWHSVLRAISMAAVLLPQPKAEEGAEQSDQPEESEEPVYPKMLVRIPTQLGGEAGEDEEDGSRTPVGHSP